jgi:transcriptional regulator with XRE-family HTH domain
MRPEERSELTSAAAALQREGWGYREIAEELGVTKSTVSRWLHRAAVSGSDPVDASRLRKPAGQVSGIMRPTKLHTLYRFYDAQGRLLYVGQTVNVPTERFVLHANEKTWWSSVANITLEHIEGSQADLDRAESLAYSTENPFYNEVRPPRFRTSS